MKRIFTLIVVCFIVLNSSAQIETCPAEVNLNAIPKFAGVPTLVSGTALQQGAVYRYNNAVTAPFNMYALVTINNIDKATVVSIDERDLANVSNDDRFQPQIKPDNATLNSDRRGLVTFTMTFYNSLTNITVPLSGLRFTHYDMDGSTNGSTGWFREMGCITNENLILTSVTPPTALVNAGNYTANGYLWKQYMGSTVEHAGISSDPEVVLVGEYLATSSVIFRMGYDFKRGNGNSFSSPAYRQYAAKFGCFTFANGPLPVKLSFFGVVGKDHKATASWTTENEINHDYFELERSFDNTNFKTIAMILGPKSTNGETRYYEYNDKSSELLTRTVAYYRLKQVDMDGKLTYSAIKLVRFDGNAISPIQISPNPFIETLNLKFMTEESGKGEVRITNVAGQTMLSKQSTISKGYNNIQINGLSRLATGMYIAQLVMNGTVIDNQRVIKN